MHVEIQENRTHKAHIVHNRLLAVSLWIWWLVNCFCIQ